MSTDFTRHTPWQDTGQGTIFRAEYGFHVHGTQEPYFSITGEEWRGDITASGDARKYGRDCVSCGCLHDMVAKHFPVSLAKLIRWHLCFVESGPMHYYENAKWWWEHWLGARLPPSYTQLLPGDESPAQFGLRIFNLHVVFGAVEGDEHLPLSASLGTLREWLIGRRPALLAAFRKDIEEHGIADLWDNAVKHWRNVNAQSGT